MRIRVALADDHTVLRAGLRALLDTLPDIVVVGEARTGREALELLADQPTDVLLMDLSMPDMDGFEATSEVVRRFPAVRVIILSMHSDAASVGQALSAGASAYLLKEGAVAELPLAMEAVMRGGQYLSPAVTAIVVQGFVSAARVPAASPLDGLTPRQKEILRLVAQGHSIKAMAHELGVSVKTVETHRRQLMERLGIFDVAGLVRLAIREGVIDES